MNLLSDLSTIHWVIVSIAAIFIWLVSFTVFCWWHYKKELRLYKNLKRKIMMINTNQSDTTRSEQFKQLRRHLEKVGVFTIPNEIVNNSDVDSTAKGKYSGIILAYDSEMQGWEAIFNVARANKLFVLIYTFGEGGDKGAVNTKANDYSHWNFANNQSSITNSLFTTLATFSPDL